MKKFMAATMMLLFASVAYAGWSSEEKSAFYELLYNPDKVTDFDSKIHMVNMIECVGAYYSRKYSFDQFETFYDDTSVQNMAYNQEFAYVSQMCKKMVDEKKTTIYI